MDEDMIEYEADPKHRDEVLQYFGMDEVTRALSCNGDEEEKEERGVDVDSYRRLAAWLNLVSQDSPDLSHQRRTAVAESRNTTLGNHSKTFNCSKIRGNGV